MNLRLITYVLLATFIFLHAEAQLVLPSIFGDHMVLQSNQDVKIWGWDTPGQDVEVSFGDQRHSTKVSESGAWSVTLRPMDVSKVGRILEITGSETLKVEDVLVGEVWLCSGQSNMQFDLKKSKDSDLELIFKPDPNIRHITIPHLGTQEPQTDFEGTWMVSDPSNIERFSAVGYYFGKILNDAIDVPIGLIDNSWGGSAAEAWVRRELLEKNSVFDSTMKKWREIEATYTDEVHQKEVEAYLQRIQKEKEEARWKPPHKLKGQHRPSNLYNGVLKPIIGLSMRGVIWYQGEGNVKRSNEYYELFPLLIDSWRAEWDIGNFSFYWVQLADYLEETDSPSASNNWATVRDAQTSALSLPKTGQSVILDLGEANDIHPVNKLDVAKRLSRHALAKDYNFDIRSESPRYKSHQIRGSKIEVTFEHVGDGLMSMDSNEVFGFAIAGEDQKFVWAEARIIDKNRVEVWSSKILNPIAIRFGWESNPKVNLYNQVGLLTTPFRTDDW